jgi:hypothetical protein
MQVGIYCMRLSVLACTAVALFLTGTGCQPQLSDRNAAALLRFHFNGFDAISAAGEGTRFQEIVRLPESQVLLRHVRDRMVLAPGVLVGFDVPPAAVEASGPLLLPLLEDVARSESLFEVWRGDSGVMEWALAVRLSEERIGVWKTNLAALAGLWQLGEVREGGADGLATVELEVPRSPRQIRWASGSSWMLVGTGRSGVAGLQAAEEALRRRQRPVQELTNGWLAVEADLGHWAALVGMPKDKPWPRMELMLGGEADSVRGTGRLVFPAEVTGALEPWQVPTNVISEPLISFTAVRGVQPLLDRVEAFRTLGIQPVPNRLFCWSQDAAEFQHFIAFPWPGASNQLDGVARGAPELLPAWVKERGLGRFEHVSTNRAVYWRDILPVVEPTFRAVQSSGEEYAVLGLFPRMLTEPPPADLLAQLNLAGLVYYHWEVTPPRLARFRVLSQLISAMTRTPQLASGDAALDWLLAIEPRLGNAATQVEAISPREWRFSRKSQLGLTAPELVVLARWLQSVEFPKPGLTLQHSARSAAPSAGR